MLAANFATNKLQDAELIIQAAHDKTARRRSRQRRWLRNNHNH
jgi:hypothetical protein